MRRLNTVVNSVLARRGLRVTRLRPGNRFDAMRDTLAGLAARGFAPDVIVDAGANVAAWARLAHDVFPAAALHLIEPQPACAGALAAFEREHPQVHVHPIAVTRPGCDQVRMTGGGSSGVRVLRPRDVGLEEYLAPAATLDALITPQCQPADRVLLKLDLEGHELDALAGAHRLLARVDVIVTEVQFFDVNLEGYPTLPEVMTTMSGYGFELYDIAALAGRPSDGRLRLGDVVFVRRDCVLARNVSWD